jgi:NAD(P)-dependent dehydrogenase (short-subunit alcohol dehydrogenase family)
VNFTTALANEWAPFNIQVNGIAPGYFETDLNADLRAQPDAFQRVLRRIPAGRMGRSEEIAPLGVYLCCSAADFVTGTTVVIDGGQLTR